MSSSQHEQERAALQAKLDSLKDGVTLRLPPQEYPGPLQITHPLTLDGQGATIWAKQGAVINVLSDGVVLRNLKIEVTGGDTTTRMEGECALSVEPNRTVQLENVEVRGCVAGLRDEEGLWLYPSSLQLGSLEFGSEHDLLLRIYVPVECRFSSSVSGLMVQPTKLVPGANEVRLHVERLPQDTLLNGSFLLTTTRLVRRIMVNAHIAAAAPATGAKKSSRSKKLQKEAQKNRVVWQPENWDALKRGELPSTIKSQPITQPSSGFIIWDDDGNASQQAAQNSPPLVTPTGSLEDKKPSVQPPPSVPPVNQHQELVEPYVPVSSRPTPAVTEPKPTGSEELYDAKSALLDPIKTMPSDGLGQGPPPVLPPSGTSGKTSKPTQPSTPSTSTPTPVPAPRPSRFIYYILGAALIAAILAAAVYFLFPFGPRTTDYVKLTHLRQLQGDEEVSSIAFSPDGKLIAGATKGGKVKLWDAVSGDVKLELPKAGDTALGEITAIAFSGDGTKIVAGTAGTNLILWNAETGARINILRGHTQRVNAVAFASDNKTIVSGAEDGTVKFWDSQSMAGSPVRSFNLDGPVKAVAASSDGTVAASTDKGTIKRWEATSASAKRDMSAYSGPVHSLAFSPDGTLLAGGTADATVVLWKTDNGARDKTLRGPTAVVLSVAFSPDGGTVVSGADKTVYLWDAVAGGPVKRALSQHSAAVYSVAVSPDGTLIASGGGDKTVHIWGNK